MTRSKLYALLLGLTIPLIAYADTKISALPAGAALTGTEDVPAVQAAATVRTTPAAIDTYVKTLGATLGVAKGGTNLTAAADDNTMVGNGTTWQTKAVPSCSGATNALTYNTTTNVWGCNTIAAGGSPGGANNAVQYNNGGAFAGGDLLWNNTTKELTVGTVATGSTVKAPEGVASAGGGLSLLAGSAAGGAFNGGAVFIGAGTPSTTGNGGGITLLARTGIGATGQGGNVALTAGGGSGSGVAGTITGTAGTGGNTAGGVVTWTAGTGGNGNDGGAASLIGGAAGSGATGGLARLIGGTPADGHGGGASVVGVAGVGTNRNGGVVTIQAGNRTGSGTFGTIDLITGAAAVRMRIDGDGSFDMAGTTPGTLGQVLTSQGASAPPQWSAAAGVAGADTQIQYNNAGSFGASGDFTWTNASRILELGGTTGGGSILRGGVGALTVTSGISGQVGQNLTVSARSASGGNSNGGTLTLGGGNSQGSGTPGPVAITAGASGGAAAGANVDITAGAAGSGAAGVVNLRTANTTRVTVDAAGNMTTTQAVISGGTTFTANVTGGSCVIGSLVGGRTAGRMTATTGSVGCNITITLPTAPNGWVCASNNVTLGAAMSQTAETTTSCTIGGTTSNNDIVNFMAIAF